MKADVFGYNATNNVIQKTVFGERKMSTQRLSANRSHIDGDDLLLFPSATPDARLLESEQIVEKDNAEHIFPTGHRLKWSLVS